MSKKFLLPVVLSGGLEPGQTPAPGLGSGQNTNDPSGIQFSWEEWLEMSGANPSWDLNGDGEYVWSEYVEWWKSNGWDETEFYMVNFLNYDGEPIEP